MRKRLILTITIVCGLCTIIYLAIFLSNKLKSIPETSNNAATVELEKPVELKPPAELEKPSTGDSDITSADSTIVTFTYDPNESMEDYLASKTSIQGSGTVSNTSIQVNGVDGSNGLIGNDGGSYEQQYWMTASEDRNKYMYAITDYDWSKGFGAVKSVKYDINIQSNLGSSAVFDAPNDTRVILRELDSRDGDASYWRERQLGLNNFDFYRSLSKPDAIPYNSEYVYGSGLKDWESLDIHYEDISYNEYSQLIADITIDTMFGEGYYFEELLLEDGTFEGHMIIQHGDRVYYACATSPVRESIKDICNAIMDRCITVY